MTTSNVEYYFYVLSNKKSRLNLVKQLIEDNEVGIVEDELENITPKQHSPFCCGDPRTSVQDQDARYRFKVATKSLKHIQTRGSEKLVSILGVGGVKDSKEQLPVVSPKTFIVKTDSDFYPYTLYKQLGDNWFENLYINIDNVGYLETV